MARRIVIPYSPRPQFKPFHTRKQRFAVIVAHRRAGKTVACVNELIKAAMKCDKPDGRFAYIAPLYSQAKDVAWTYVKQYATPVLAGAPNETELRVDLLNGSRIRLYGADNPDRLRGLYLDGVILDEYADMKPRAWGEVIRPALSDRQGWAVFIGTPKGKNEFWEIWERGRDDARWYRTMLRASETGILPAEELEAARLDMAEEEYEQEYECSFEAAIRGAYFGKEMAAAEREGRVTAVPYEPAKPVYTAWDIGVRDATAIWFFQLASGNIRVIDYYEAVGEGLAHYAKVLQDKPYVYGIHYGPHDLANTEWGSGKSRIETARSLKVNFSIVPDVPLMDGINAARLTLPICWFDAERCATGIEALKQYRKDWDEERRVFRDKPLHNWASHAADAFRYLAVGYRERTQTMPKDPLRQQTMGELVNEHFRRRRTARYG